ncbi:MAG: hypothetical protein M3Y35_13585 [Actinomycetota bacterium]|nr:hypothetical protein [Actinomycetota bacterium]
MSVVLMHPLVSLLGADAAAVHATRSFVGVMLAFVPVLAAAFSLQQLMPAEGAARQVMIGLIASTVANLAFDVLFILVLHWGVAGAALAMGLPTSASRISPPAQKPRSPLPSNTTWVITESPTHPSRAEVITVTV